MFDEENRAAQAAEKNESLEAQRRMLRWTIGASVTAIVCNVGVLIVTLVALLP